MANEDAETDVRNLGRQLHAVVEVADALERIGSLKQATQDAVETTRKAREEIVVVGAKLLEVQEKVLDAANDLKHTREEKVWVLAEAEEEVTDIIADAEEKAEKLASESADAVRDAHEVITAEREEHVLFMKAADLKEAEAQRALDVINSELKTLRERIG